MSETNEQNLAFIDAPCLAPKDPEAERPANPLYDDRGRSRNPSCVELGRGGADLADKIKAKNLGIVKVTTDDAEVFGYLIRNDEANFIRVGTVVKALGHGRLDFRILSIARSRIAGIHHL